MFIKAHSVSELLNMMDCMNLSPRKESQRLSEGGLKGDDRSYVVTILSLEAKAVAEEFWFTERS